MSCCGRTLAAAFILFFTKIVFFLVFGKDVVSLWVKNDLDV